MDFLWKSGRDQKYVRCTHFIAKICRLLDVNIRFADAIWPTATKRYSAVEKVYSPKDSLSHVDLKGCVRSPRGRGLLVEPCQEAISTRLADDAVGSISLVGVHQVNSLRG